MALPPFTPSTTLQLLRGRSRDFLLQVYNTDGTAATGIFLSTDTTAATLWSGDGQTPSATPTVTWANSNPAAGIIQISFNNSDTASLTPGNYFLEATLTRSGRTGTLAWTAFVLIDSAGTYTGNPLDLVTMAQAQAALAQVLPSDQSFIATAITAASRAVQRYCRRWFIKQQYIEILQPQPGEWDKGQADMIWLKQYPVIGAPMLKAGWTNALQIINTQSTTNQEAYVGFTTSGDPDITLTNTGLTLTSIASGVANVQNVTWTTASPYTTIGAIAAQINVLGNGWQATVQQPAQANLGAYNLYGSGGASNALSPGQTMLNVFQQPLAFSGFEWDTGLVYLQPGAWYGGYGSGFGATCAGDWMWMGGDAGGGGSFRPPVLCVYTAGYATIPEDVQTAVLAVVKAILQEMQTDTRYSDRRVDVLDFKLAGMEERVFPKPLKKFLAPWRIHRVN